MTLKGRSSFAYLGSISAKPSLTDLIRCEIGTQTWRIRGAFREFRTIPWILRGHARTERGLSGEGDAQENTDEIRIGPLLARLARESPRTNTSTGEVEVPTQT